MSEVELEKRVKALSDKIDSLFFSFRAVFFLLLLFASAGNWVAVLFIDHYRWIYYKAFGPDHPFPALTLAVFAAKDFLLVLVFFWLAIGFVAVLNRHRILLGTCLFCVALLGAVLQTAIVYVAMHLPMVTLINGMSDAH